MRRPPDERFDLVLCLYHSFGFFDDDENEATLRAWRERLAPGGFFVLDVWNRDLIVRRFEPERRWVTEDGLHIHERRQFDPSTSRLRVHYTYVYPGGARRDYDASFRLYSRAELASLFAGCALEVTSMCGSLTGEPSTLDATRLVVFGRNEAKLGRTAREAGK